MLQKIKDTIIKIGMTIYTIIIENINVKYLWENIKKIWGK